MDLPRARRPQTGALGRKWAQIQEECGDPVCPLRVNLYGHPLAGLLWEKWCQDNLIKEGFESVPGWECLYVHRAKKLFLSVYVDDFKAAGDGNSLLSLHSDLKKNMNLDPPVKFDQSVYLGCEQRDVTIPQELVEEKNQFIDSILNQEKWANASAPMRSNAKTSSSKPAIDMSTIRGFEYRMIGHAQQSVERYCELAKTTVASLKKVTTPCIDDHLIPPEDFVSKGELSPVASRIVLKALYLARLGRPELLWAVNSLAREVTKWTVACDKRLHRLISYIHHHQDVVITSYVGDPAHLCFLILFSDASFAGDLVDSKSTTGGFLVLVGPHTWCPITWMCKKQGAVSHSSSEAEIIALDACTRMEGLPALMLWDLVVHVFADKSKAHNSTRKTPATGSSVLTDIRNVFEVDFVPPSVPMSSGLAKLILLEDNDAVIKMTLKMRAPTLRHVPRTHRVDLDWLFERIMYDPGVSIHFVGTKQQIADMFTKGQFSEQQWKALCRMAQIGDSYHTASPKTTRSDSKLAKHASKPK